MSPALSREERDAIRARAEAVRDAETGPMGPLEDWALALRRSALDVPALLVALDAAEEERDVARRNSQRWLAERDAARAETAALRERIERLADDLASPVRGTRGRVTVGDLRALAAAPSETERRDRYRLCDDCTTDCGACKGQGRPREAGR